MSQSFPEFDGSRWYCHELGKDAGFHETKLGFNENFSIVD